MYCIAICEVTKLQSKMDFPQLYKLYRTATGKYSEALNFKDLVLDCILYENPDVFLPYIREIGDNILLYDILWNTIHGKRFMTLIEILIRYFKYKLKFIINNLDAFNIKTEEFIYIMLNVFSFKADLLKHCTEEILKLCNRFDIITIINNFERAEIDNVISRTFIYHLVINHEGEYCVMDAHSFLSYCSRIRSQYFYDYINPDIKDTIGDQFIVNIIRKYKLECHSEIIAGIMWDLLANKEDNKSYLALYDMGYRCIEPLHILLALRNEDTVRTVKDLNISAERLAYDIVAYIINNNNQKCTRECIKAIDLFAKDFDEFIEILDTKYIPPLPWYHLHNTIFILTYVRNVEIPKGYNQINQILKNFSMEHLLGNSSIKKWKANFRLMFQFYKNLNEYFSN